MAAPAMPPMIPPPDGDQDRGPQLMAMFWVEAAVSIILVSLRLHVRFANRALGADDWMMLFTVILFVVMASFVTKLALIGGARHVYYLTQEQVLNAVKWTWIPQPLGIFLFAPAKSSVAVLILRIIGPHTVWRRWLLYFLIGSMFLISSLGFIFSFAQCNPPRALWTPGLPAKCWNPLIYARYGYVLAGWNIMTDIVLALLPVTILWNMKMKSKKKIALCCLLGLGLIAAVVSAYKIRYIIDVSSRVDFTWGVYNMQAWTGAEAFIVIVCGNIPPLQPLWDRYVTRNLESNSGRTPVNQYKMSGPSAYTGRSGSKKYSLPSSSTEAGADSTWGGDEERLNIKATTEIRVSESSR